MGASRYGGSRPRRSWGCGWSRPPATRAQPRHGSPTLHQQEQQELLDRAFAGLKVGANLNRDQGGAAMKVRDVASSAVVAVGPAQSLREATNRGQAPGGLGRGPGRRDADRHLAERDVLNAVAYATTPKTVSVEQIMTADVVTVGPDWDLIEAAKVMASRRIRHLVVYEAASSARC